MGGICSAQGNACTGHMEDPFITLEDFNDDEKQYVDQLARISSQSAHLLPQPVRERVSSARGQDRTKVNPIVAKQFVDTAKVIKGRQQALLKQISQLGALFEMSATSLRQSVQALEKAPAESQNDEAKKKAESVRSLKKSIENVGRSQDKLFSLKTKVRKLDPNQESVNDLRVKLTNSQLKINPLEANVSMQQIRKSAQLGDGDLGMGMASDSEEAQGKIQEYLDKLNELLREYERDRVIESAMLNLSNFNALLQAFMDLPEVDQLLELVAGEDLATYKVLDEQSIAQILELEKKIEDSQDDTTKLFPDLELIQRLTGLSLWQDNLALVAEQKQDFKDSQISNAAKDVLTELKARKLAEVSQLEHEVNVIMLSNKELGEQIQECQQSIKASAQQFDQKASENQLEEARTLVYSNLIGQVYRLRVLLSGTQLSDCIEQLIELNQQITLEMNDFEGTEAANQKGVQLEAQLVACSDELEEAEETNGFIDDADIKRVQEKVLVSLPQLVAQERERDRLQSEKQIQMELEETADAFDSIAELVSVHSKVKVMMVQLETEVFEVAQSLFKLPPHQAESLKAKVWTMWNAQQEALELFNQCRFGRTEVTRFCSLIREDGSVQLSVQLSEIKDSLAAIQAGLLVRVKELIESLKSDMQANSQEESKTNDAPPQPLMVIAENNELNTVDKAIELILVEEQLQLSESGYRLEFPPIFRKRAEQQESADTPESTAPNSSSEQSVYCLWTGFKLHSWTSTCSVVKKEGEEYFGVKPAKGAQSKDEIARELKKVKLGLKMQGGAYMYVNRLGSYHSNLSLDTFFNIKLRKLQ